MTKGPLRRAICLFCLKPRQMLSYHRVLAMYGRGDFAGAYAAICRGIENHPECSKGPYLYVLWADLELRLNGDISKARYLLDEALRVGPSDWAFYYKTRAWLMWESGERERSIQDLEKSVEADPQVANLTEFASTLSNVDDKRAMSIWERILEKDPDNCLAHAYVGHEALKSGDRGKALLMAKKAEELHSSAQDIFLIGRLYHELEEFKTAVQRYSEADKLGYEDNGSLYAHIAACYCSLGDMRAARKYIKRAVRCSPEDDYVKEVQRECEQRLSG